MEQKRGNWKSRNYKSILFNGDEHQEAGNPRTISSNLYWPALPSPGSLRCATSARHVAVGNPGTKRQYPFITKLDIHSFSDSPFPEKLKNFK